MCVEVMRRGVEGQARITVTVTVQGTQVGQMVIETNGGQEDTDDHDDGVVADMDMQMECGD